MSSLEKYLSKPFPHFLTGLFIILLLSCRKSLCILDMNPLSDIWFANIFFHSVGCLFTVLTVSSALQKIFSLIQSWRGRVFVCFGDIREIIFVILLTPLILALILHLSQSFPSVCLSRKCCRGAKMPRPKSPHFCGPKQGQKIPRQFILVSGIFFFNSIVT